MRGALERLLYSRIADHVTVRFGTEVESFEQDEAQVRVAFTDGSVGSFDLLVGADGVHSRHSSWTIRGCEKASVMLYTR